MRIAILIDEYAPGAMPKIALNEAEELRKLGHKTKIITCTKFGKLEPGFNYIFPAWVSALKFRFPFFSFFAPQHLLNIFYAKRLNRFDLVIAHGFFAGLIAVHSNTIVYTIFWDPTSTMIEKIYSKGPLRFLVKLAEWADCYVCRKSHKVMIGSSYHSQWFTKHQVKVKIVYPGCKPSYSRLKRTLDYVAIDRWDIGSNPSVLLTYLPANGVFNIAGSWKSKKARQSFEAEIKKKNIGYKVNLLGRIPEYQLNKLYDTCKLLIHPTAESFGMTGLEAAARGCPIYFLHRSGVNDIIGNLLSPEETYNQAKKYTWKRHAKELLCD